jgi:hypothetical protein
MPSVTNWLTQDESHPSAGAASSSAVRARRKARRSLGMRLLAASLVFAGLVAVVLAVLLQSGGGGPGPLSADAPAPGTVVGLGSSAADGADRVSVDARAVPRDATAPLPDAGPPPDRPTGTGQDAAAAPVDAGAAEPPTALVTISLAGLPDGAEAFVAGVKAVDGVAQVPRSDEPVALKATAPGFLDFETTLVPAEDMIFLVPMDPAPAPPVDAGTDVRPGRDARVVVRRDVVTTVRRDDAATTTVRRDDAGTTTVRPDDAATTRRDDGGASATRRDDGGRRGPDIPIIINYGREP